MTRFKLLSVGIALAGMMAIPLGVSHAQDFPSKPVRVLLPVPPGGALGAVALAIGAEFEKRTGHPMVIEPKVGANTTIMMNACKDATPDGHTICLVTRSGVSLNPAVYKNLPYDPLKDLKPITAIFHANHFLIVNKSVPVKSFKELVAYTKANPDKVNFGSFGVGGDSHLVVEWIGKVTGAKLTHVPYRGAGPGLKAFAADEVQMFFLLMGNPRLLGQVKKGEITPLAVSGSKRHPLLPDVPSLVELGLPEKVAKVKGWFGYMAPAATPDDRIAKLNAVITAILKDPAFVKKFMVPNAFDPAPMSPSEFAAFIKDDVEPGRELVEATGIKLD